MENTESSSGATALSGSSPSPPPPHSIAGGNKQRQSRPKLTVTLTVKVVATKAPSSLSLREGEARTRSAELRKAFRLCLCTPWRTPLEQEFRNARLRSLAAGFERLREFFSSRGEIERRRRRHHRLDFKPSSSNPSEEEEEEDEAEGGKTMRRKAARLHALSRLFALHLAPLTQLVSLVKSRVTEPMTSPKRDEAETGSPPLSALLNRLLVSASKGLRCDVRIFEFTRSLLKEGWLNDPEAFFVAMQVCVMLEGGGGRVQQQPRLFNDSKACTN